MSKASCAFREKNLSYNGGALRFLAIALTIMYAWILIWALVLKLCDHDSLISNYYNLRNMTIEERIMWDIIPFNYRGADVDKAKQILATFLNCFVLAPFGVTLQYSFKKRNLLRDLLICLGFTSFIEITQLFTTFANFATEDFITNLAGYFIGLIIYLIFFRRLSEKTTVRLLAVFAVIGAVLTAYTMMTAINSAELIFKLITRTY